MIKRDFHTIEQEVRSQSELILKNGGLTFLKPKFFRVNETQIAKEQDGVNAAVIDNSETNSDSKSLFGLPVFDALLFEDLRYTTSDGINVHVVPFSMSTVLIDISQNRNIVKTAISGRNGTVKEYISDGDYVINIKGVLASQYQNIAPKDSMNQLLGFCKAPVSFAAGSNFLFYFGITTIVIQDYSFNQIEGQINTIGFSLSCLSDTSIEIAGSKHTSVPSFL